MTGLTSTPTSGRRLIEAEDMVLSGDEPAQFSAEMDSLSVILVSCFPPFIAPLPNRSCPSEAVGHR